MITVSICTQTYNHKEYIKECLDSFVRQKTNFEFEILVHDDASTDGTAELVKEYEEKYPQLFNNVYQTENQYGKINSLTEILFKKARGKYIAICEGDDYWSDPNKLQKQVDFLVNNPECFVCHTWHSHLINKNGDWIDEEAPKSNKGYLEQTFSTVEIILKNQLRLKSRTVMFRNELEFPETFRKVPYGDIAMSILFGKYGKYGFIDEPTAVYRIHSEGASNANKGEKYRLIQDRFNLLESLYFAKDVFGNKYDDLLMIQYKEKLQEISKTFRRDRNAFKVLISRIDQLCTKYNLNSGYYKRIARWIWVLESMRIK